MANLKLSPAAVKKLGDDVRAAEDPFVAAVSLKCSEVFRSRYPKLRHDALMNGGKATLDLSVTCDFNAETRSITIVHQPTIMVPEAQHVSAAVAVPNV